VIEVSRAVEDLQSRWHTLCDLDRARAVQSIHQAGMSFQELAPKLNCSPSLLSHLLRALEAPAEDRELARSGDISTRELVRKAQSSGFSMQREARAFDYEREVMKASQAIMRWFNEENVASADREQVVEQAFLLLVNADTSEAGPLEAYLPDIPLGEVIRLFRPACLGIDGDSGLALLSEWLALWTLHGILDDRVRARALELARKEMPDA
jgi:hypothetical protein